MKLSSIDACSLPLRLQFMGEVIILVALGRHGIWVSGAEISEVEERYLIGAFGGPAPNILRVIAGEEADVKVFFGGGIFNGFEPLDGVGVVQHAVPSR